MKMKSFIAGVSAVAMTAAMATLSIPAFAEELQMVEMETAMI
ncbi:MAG: hypothetical protein PUG85_08700 [Oscillospiraceae bacterium]|nr:hypothetical protein [Oscillospiraceae bacterium]MDY2511004.1 hypothetical protein [Ruminococcus callidus]